MHNSVVKQFFKSHGINEEYILNSVDCRLYKTVNFMGEISKAIIYKPQYKTKVSIGDIYGCDGPIKAEGDSIFDTLDVYYQDEPKKRKSLFKRNDEHCLRSNDKLMLNTEAMIEEAGRSSEPISVCRVDNTNNINLIYTNGMHRYLALRALYLKEISYHPDSIKKIKDDFKIDVYLNEIDEIKTFCLFIFRHYQKQNGLKVGYKLEYVNHEYTGRLQFCTFESNNIKEEFVFDDNGLINFVRPFIDLDLDYYKSIDVPSFRNFLISLGYCENPVFKMK